MRPLPWITLLAGCPGDPLAPCQGRGESTWWADLEPQGMTRTEPTVALTLEPGDAEGPWSVDASFHVENTSDTDCVFAVYISDVPPDPSTVPTFAVDELPPPAIAGLGELLVADLVSRRWTEPGTVYPIGLEVADGPAQPVYFTLVGCAGMSSSASFGVSSCDPRIAHASAEVGW